MKLHIVDSRSGRAARPVLFVLFLLAAVALIAPAARPATADEGIVTVSPAEATAALSYSTFLGGNSADSVRAMALDSQGNIYVAGETFSQDFLGYDSTPYGYSDIFVAKLDPSGKNVLYLSMIGSKDSDKPQSIAVDAQGNAYVTVVNYADDFPLLNPLWDEYPDYSHNGVLFKLDQNGNGVYSTLLPLNMFEATSTLAVDPAGNAYIVGSDWRDNGGNQIGLLKINPSGTQVLLQKYYGGSSLEDGTAIAIDGTGNIYLTGMTKSEDFPTTANAIQKQCGDLLYGDETYCYEDGLVMVLNSGGQVLYSSYLGGSFTDEPVAIAADGHGNIVIAGNTTSGVFPTKNALQTSCPVDPNYGDCYFARGFVSQMRLTNGQASLVYSTYLGSSENYSTNSITAATISSGGQATVVGYTNGKVFPTASAVQRELSLGLCLTFSSERFCFDGFATTFSPAGALAFSTYLGGSDDEFPYGVRLGGNGTIYVAGMTESINYPTTTGALQPNSPVNDDGFLARIDSGVVPPPPPPPPPPPLGKHNIYLQGILR